ncbi:hypothetical protein B5E41_08380 [Rhizobium esperanzae]|uniref:Uncharacterized protein n=1 Tax=Rhizobium esperanzae TaxID=1967781 RepID=A0A246DZW6_9HYPH|nr:hypothetical protein [Rhizobium esperanzae]OWO95827.1 hypothetical protein B5E41_08380 [Rhizobium esperanzae]
MRESHLKELGPQATALEAIAFEGLIGRFESFQGGFFISSNTSQTVQLLTSASGLLIAVFTDLSGWEPRRQPGRNNA